MAGTFTKLIYHIVFSTKGRKPQITARLQPELYRYLGGLVKEKSAVPLAIGGMPDHVHLVVRCRPNIAPADLLRFIKANSSRWINEQRRFGTRFAWQSGYSAFSVSQSQLPALIRYVRNQAEHHRRRTFREELAAILERHQIEYDAKYLVD
jgi:REP-associated tyrosine transposase